MIGNPTRLNEHDRQSDPIKRAWLCFDVTLMLKNLLPIWIRNIYVMDKLLFHVLGP